MSYRSARENLLSLVALAVFVLLGIGSVETDTGTKKVQSEEPVYSVTASQLTGDYSDNAVAADNKYKGQVIVVSGEIKSIGKDIMNQAYVIIGGGGFLDGVQCVFTKGEESSVAALSKGQQVVIKGQVSGKVGNVILKNCRLQ